MSEPSKSDFIRDIIADDLATGKHSTVITRFPPEPNGYLHIGHAKSICLNFGIALENEGVKAQCNLRFDDTNPEKEETEYVESIKEDVKWLGFDWGEGLYFASNYFGFFHDCAVHLIREGKAYVDDQTAEEMKHSRGNVNVPGTPSPFRDRTVEENLDLFARMKAGEFKEGEKVLRAKIDLASPNMNLRDPVLYRILHSHHHNTGDAWCIYPMYDFAHPLEDALEHITHSLCTLEFENHRPLYDWFIDNCPVPSKPRQIEFARLNLTYTVMSKRKLLQLVQENRVSGWDDPRLPTISGIRRRGYPPEAVRHFCKRVGITKFNGTTDVALLEFDVRDHLNASAQRRMAVLDPVKVVLENWSAEPLAIVEIPNHPQNPELGARDVPISGEVWIEREDFMEDPPKKFFRLGPGRHVRLRGGHIIRCTSFEKDAAGNVSLIRAEILPGTVGADAPEGVECRAAIHWVDAATGADAEVRIYDRLFSVESPDDADGGFLTVINPDSLKTVTAKIEPSLAEAPAGFNCQFERVGYFVTDLKEHRPGVKAVFNRTVALKDSWAKQAGK
ncbi:glutamine--tRNA ligase/YqeY domain fusion protein [Luteolibacter sp. SL250]|uniref:glutamine--tRNA ligase/YqeY domain fusion protein n=1 Tax=Luteolibacter sp. SL250 TaxID=2995170 RepID=UPI00226EC327|nr:glutamine--tRNA ligase/YqeY domain fusion protein [Luteolibacter sp. SL250]WAC18529.1 glutamine--tRNA ligase/YqeY domain fusion protein [Luteolibacter sp. SL250]